MNEYEKTRDQLKQHRRTWLITGVAGFIGSNLLETLLKLDQRVVGLDQFLTGHQRNLDEVKSLVTGKQWGRFTFMEGDIREQSTCAAACSGIDIVLHQAALGSVPRSIQDPVETNGHNLTGFLNMINAAKNAGVNRFVYASSSSVYGDHPDLPKTEDQMGNPLSPYALTKQVNEKYAHIFSRLHGLQCIGLRYFNVFGPRQDPDGPYAAVIPKWFAALIEGNRVCIYGDGETSRDFCFIDNVVQANLLAGCTENEMALNQVFNVACGERITLNELFRLIRGNVVRTFPYVSQSKAEHQEFRAGDIRHSLAGIEKARQLLGYEPAYSVRSGLKKASEWYISSSKQHSMQHRYPLRDFRSVGCPSGVDRQGAL